MDWWNELGIVKQCFYAVAVPATIILIIQSILSIIGLSNGDADFDGIELDEADIGEIGDLDTETELQMIDADQSFLADFRFFTIRGLIAFFTVFGWLGGILSDSLNIYLAILLAVLAGVSAMFVIGLLFYGMTKLQQTGTLDYRNCIGQTGEVYLTIPPNQTGKGKVTVTVQERFVEVNAITEEQAPIKSGELIEIIGMRSDHTAIVKKQISKRQEATGSEL